MVRKLSLSALAVAALGMAVLAPTAADAGHKGKVWNGPKWHGHVYYGGPTYYAGHYASCWVKRWVPTPYGPRLKRIYICY